MLLQLSFASKLLIAMATGMVVYSTYECLGGCFGTIDSCDSEGDNDDSSSDDEAMNPFAYQFDPVLAGPVIQMVEGSETRARIPRADVDDGEVGRTRTLGPRVKISDDFYRDRLAALAA